MSGLLISRHALSENLEKVERRDRGIEERVFVDHVDLVAHDAVRRCCAAKLAQQAEKNIPRNILQDDRRGDQVDRSARKPRAARVSHHGADVELPQQRVRFGPISGRSRG